MAKEDVLGGVVSDMPQPMEHAIEAEQQSQPSDKRFVGFDPKVHESKDGQPQLRTDGTFKKKRGRGAASAQSKLDLPGTEPGSSPGDAGKQIAESIFAMGQLLGGEEWKPITNPQYGIDERAQMYDAWTRYCESKQINDIPPGLAVVIVTVGYVAPRFAMPKTKSRWEKAKIWAAEKWWRWKGRKDGAQPDSRTNGKRKDDTGESIVAEVSA